MRPFVAGMVTGLESTSNEESEDGSPFWRIVIVQSEVSTFTALGTRNLTDFLVPVILWLAPVVHIALMIENALI